MLVRDVMSTDVVTVSRTATVKAAIVLLARHHITSMPVLDRDGRVCGVVSEADLVHDLVPSDPRAHELPVEDEWRDRPRTVGEVMSTHVLSVQRDADVAAVVELITDTAVKSVPVVNAEHRVVGVLSRSDLVRVLARADADLGREVDTLLASVGLDDWVAEVSDGVVGLTGPDKPSRGGWPTSWPARCPAWSRSAWTEDLSPRHDRTIGPVVRLLRCRCCPQTFSTTPGPRRPRWPRWSRPTPRRLLTRAGPWGARSSAASSS